MNKCKGLSIIVNIKLNLQTILFLRPPPSHRCTHQYLLSGKFVKTMKENGLK